MSKNKKIVWGIVSVVVLVAVFYGGVSYGKGQTATTARASFAGRTRGTGGFGAGTAGGLTVGSIITKDATSMTLSLMSGGSKIVFLDNTTKISKQTNGTLADLTIGTQVSVMGAANTDGSINATTVQIRPNTPTSTTPPVVQ